jgi:hypothetical protein
MENFDYYDGRTVLQARIKHKSLLRDFQGLNSDLKENTVLCLQMVTSTYEDFSVVFWICTNIWDDILYTTCTL